MTASQDSRIVESALRVDQDATFSSDVLDPRTGAAANGLADMKASSEGVADVLRSVEDRLSGRKFDDRLAQLNERIDGFSEQLNKLCNGFKVVSDRLDSLDQRVAAVTATSEAKFREIESPAVDSLSGAGLDVVSKLDSRFESLENILRMQFEKVNGLVGNTDNTSGWQVKVNAGPVADPVALDQPTTDQVADVAQAMPAEEDPSAHWQDQKQAMYGGDAEVSESCAAVASETIVENPAAQASDSDQAVAVAETTVDELKRELNAKIRAAEVEMSINRARSMQERVEFERAKADFERRAATLEAKLAASTEENVSDKEGGNNIMSRFKRHLGS